MLKLRDYQQKLVHDLKSRLQKTTDPLLVTLSVGGGKSLCIADVLLWIESFGYRALCLTLNSTLIEQNANTYKSQGGHCGVYCTLMNSHETEQLVIFGSPQSVCNGIRDEKKISKVRFNLIVIDEAHNVHPHDRDTMYQRIIHHYGLLAQSEQYSYRIIGLTGTPYRGKGESIVGDDQFFKEEVCNIPASFLIERGWLVPPVFGLTESPSFDFSKLKVKSTGKFSGAELSAIVDTNERLTGQIMQELQKIMQSHNGAFIFAATIKHCYECAKSLPDGQWAVITGKTKHEDRKKQLEMARTGAIKYLISFGCLNVGVDVPFFDVCVILTATESLVKYTQSIGRVLRLHRDKTRAIILDYAGNLTRHGDIDDPIINDALKPREDNEKEYIIPCIECGTFNTITARRCIGIDKHNHLIRCSNYFEWKDCPKCGLQNDRTSRICRGCEYELIDPNKKLSRDAISNKRELFDVHTAKFWAIDNPYGVQFNAMFETTIGLRIYESYTLRDDKMRNIFYGCFVKKHVDNAHDYYPVLKSLTHLKRMIQTNSIKIPYQIECVFKGKYRITKRFFNETNIID